jgi:hypothetical protein
MLPIEFLFYLLFYGYMIYGLLYLGEKFVRLIHHNDSNKVGNSVTKSETRLNNPLDNIFDSYQINQIEILD